MKVIVEGNLRFEFSDNWQIEKFDDWSFYRNQFIKISEGIRGIDIIALSPNNYVWLIEVKDYRVHPRTKPVELSDEIVQKVICTLAALLPAQVNANEDNEKQMARRFLDSQKIRVILHLEQPAQHSKLFPRAIDLANVQQQLRRKLKAIDPHPRVLETMSMGNEEWIVRKNVPE